MNAVLYCRISPKPKGRADVCESIETQLDRLRAYCRAMDWAIVAELEDREASGGDDEEKRPGLAEALKLAVQHRAALTVYALARLSRDTEDALRFERLLRKKGAALVSLNERIDTTTAMGRFAFTVFAGQATLERELTAERTSDAMLRRQKDGQRMSFAHVEHARSGRQVLCTPYGWKPDYDGPKTEAGLPARMIEDEQEQQAIALVRELANKGETFRAIAKRLEAGGWPCRGKKWHHSTVKTILDRAAKGPAAPSNRAAGQ